MEYPEQDSCDSGLLVLFIHVAIFTGLTIGRTVILSAVEESPANSVVPAEVPVPSNVGRMLAPIRLPAAGRWIQPPEEGAVCEPSGRRGGYGSYFGRSWFPVRANADTRCRGNPRGCPFPRGRRRFTAVAQGRPQGTPLLMVCNCLVSLQADGPVAK